MMPVLRTLSLSGRKKEIRFRLLSTRALTLSQITKASLIKRVLTTRIRPILSLKGALSSTKLTRQSMRKSKSRNNQLRNSKRTF